MGLTYAIGKFSIGTYLRLRYRFNVTGCENIPNKGGVILCCNHISAIDPLALTVSLKREVHFLGKKEIFKNKFFSFILRKIHVIPVDRSKNDIQAYKTMIKVLDNGHACGIFAQGTRVKGEEEKSAKSGVSLFALKTGAPVVPICISSDYKRGGTIHINIGKPVDLSEFTGNTDSGKKIKSEILSKMTEKIMKEIFSLSTYTRER